MWSREVRFMAIITNTLSMLIGTINNFLASYFGNSNCFTKLIILFIWSNSTALLFYSLLKSQNFDCSLQFYLKTKLSLNKLIPQHSFQANREPSKSIVLLIWYMIGFSSWIKIKLSFVFRSYLQGKRTVIRMLGKNNYIFAILWYISDILHNRSETNVT